MLLTLRDVNAHKLPENIVNSRTIAAIKNGPPGMLARPSCFMSQNDFSLIVGYFSAFLKKPWYLGKAPAPMSKGFWCLGGGDL